jgi:predicted ATPase/DNA-binding XRE family transcriptional regulator
VGIVWRYKKRYSFGEKALVELSFGEWLKRQRKALGLTQDGLANQVGCSAIAIRKIEAEERRPSAQIAERIANIFGVSKNDQKFFLRFARGDAKFTPADRKKDTPWRALPVRTNLPAAVTSLIGREKETADTLEYLRRTDIRLVTLVGPPGIGKTRLSLDAAHTSLSDFPDGVFFVALAPLDGSFLVAPAILQALGFVEAPNQSPSKQLMAGIGDKHILIVLDNCEHLIEDVAPLASGLLSACSRLKIIATSREALRVPGEWVYTVPALGIPPKNLPVDVESIPKFSALTLFVERARAANSDFIVDAGNIHAVTSICEQLDGLPLAIELIAARIRLMSPQALLERMNEQFVLSADGMRAVSVRQKTLNNAIGWSYNLLSPEEKNFFARLSIFSGGWTLESAQAICGGDVLRLTNSIMKKSLITANRIVGKETRYRFHETIGQFAREKLRTSGEMKIYCLRHLVFFAEMVVEAERSFKGADHALWYNRLDDEQDNLRAALTWFEGVENAEIRLRFAAGLWRYWKNRGHIGEGRMHLKNILESIPLGSHRQSPAYARALTASGSLAYYEGDMSYSEQSRKEALAIFRNLDDKTGIADCLNGLGNTAISQGNYDLSSGFYKESLVIRKKLDDKWGVARLLGNLGLLAYFQSDFIQARSLHLESLALFRELRNEEGVVNELVNLGDVFYCQGDLSIASSFYEESAVIARKLKDQWGLAYAVKGMADVVFKQGDLATASSLFGECITVFHKGADYIGLPFAFESVAALACAKNKLEAATRIFGVADALRKSSNSPLPPPNHDAYQMNLSILHQRLDPGQFEFAWTDGRSMTLDEAVAYALEVIL